MDNNHFQAPYGNQMIHGIPGEYRNTDNEAKTVCQRYMNYHVIGKMANGSQMEGIITNMDNECVTMLVPEDVEEEDQQERQYEGYGGYGRRRFRRFRRRRFPYYFFAFPFFVPYPYYYYPYPYPYY